MESSILVLTKNSSSETAPELDKQLSPDQNSLHALTTSDEVNKVAIEKTNDIIESVENIRDPRYTPKGSFFEHDDRSTIEKTLPKKDTGKWNHDLFLKLEAEIEREHPEYIPRKSQFYGHDDRSGSDTGIDDNNKIKKYQHNDKYEKTTKRKWSHDLYREEEQKPKTRHEIVRRYGYDIRKYDNPNDCRSCKKRTRRISKGHD